MKKTLKTLLLTLLFFIALALFSNVKANSISKISLDIYVDSYGTAHVTESWKCSASNGTEVYHPYYNLGNSQIQNLTVSDETRTYDTLFSWSTSGSLSSKAYKCGINKISDGVELCWGISTYGSHTYTVKYNITNFVSELSDGNQMIYWTLIPYDFSNTIGSVYIKIYADRYMPNTIDVWGYGNTGYTYVYDGYIEMDSDGKLPSNNYMTILAKFPNGYFNTSNKLNHDFNYYFNMAEKGTRENPKNKTSTIVKTLNFISISLFVGLWVFILTTISISTPKFNLGITKKELKNSKDYFRDIPCDNIYKAYYLAYQGGILKNTTDILGAIILKWIKDDIVTIKELNKKSAIILSGANTSKITDNKELELFNMLDKASKDGTLENKEFENWCKTNYNKILKWFDEIIKREQNKLITSREIILEKRKILFMTKSYYNFQPSLTEELKHIANLKKYLLDYTLIKDREAIEVHLFEEYLIYAQMLGIAKQVAKQFKELYPEIIQESCYSTYDNFLFINAWCASGITSANTAKARANSYSSGGGGYSSSGGGGGSFGGGGGGGGFR